MKELWSHPHKLLIDHLREVATIASATVTKKGYDFSLHNGIKITQRQLTDLTWIAGAFHDLAKATSYFQEYIRDPEKIHSHLKNHALLSSVFSYFLAVKYCNQEVNDKFLAELLPLFVLIAVKRHHGSIENLEKELVFDNTQIENLSIQIKNVNPYLVEPVIDQLLADVPIKATWREFIDFWESKIFQSKLKDFRFLSFKFNYPKIDQQTRSALFYLFQVIYSTLMYADKNDVILEDLKVSETFTDISNQLNKFRDRKGFNHTKSEIDQLKNKAYFNSLLNLEKVFTPAQHIYSLTLPTGLGKTLTAFAVANKLRELTGNKTAKIIINIPFTSIIDQNFGVFREVLETESSQILLKHHHLAEPVYKDESEKVYDFNKSQFLIETWQSETIVTTFVQFLETILSMDKTKLMKLALLRNSIVLLDEIQTIPYPLWETIRESFKTLGETMNMYFVLISATQPLIFAPDEDIVEIIPNHKSYFKFFNRTRIYYQEVPVFFDDFIEKVFDYALNEPKKDILVILNTKDAARKCFEQLVKSNLGDLNFYYLSTLITPFERKQIIKKIKRKDGKRKLIVSTQLIEAGVDISVDTIFRQLSPIDSIIQSAGRANRYNEKNEISKIFIYEIEDLKKATNLIYGSDLIVKTKNVLKNFCQIEESDFLELIERYFREVRKQSDETTSDLLNAILGLRFAEINLNLIEGRKTESVFIQINREAKKIWAKFIQIYNQNELNPWERKAAFSKIKSQFYDYIINVPVPRDEITINFDSGKIYGFYVSEFDSPSQFYSYSKNDLKLNTGYNSKEIICF